MFKRDVILTMMGVMRGKFGMAQEDQMTKSVDPWIIPIWIVLLDSIVEQVALNEDQMFDCVANKDRTKLYHLN